MMTFRQLLGAIATACLFVTSACGGYDLTPPAALDDGWSVTEPETVGLDAGPIVELFEQERITEEVALSQITDKSKVKQIKSIASGDAEAEPEPKKKRFGFR